MPLPIPDVARERTQTRRVRFEGRKRADGLWDIDEWHRRPGDVEAA